MSLKLVKDKLKDVHCCYICWHHEFIAATCVLTSSAVLTLKWVIGAVAALCNFKLIIL